MPADPSIYGLIRPMQPAPGPLEQYTQGLQVRTLMGQNDLQAMQREQLARNMQEELATQEAYRKSGGDPTRLRELLYGQGLYKPAMAAEKAGLDIAKTRGEIDKTKAETVLKQTEYLRDKLANVQDQASYDQWRMEVANTQGMQAAANLPPQFSTQWREQQLMKAQDLIVPLKDKLKLEQDRQNHLENLAVHKGQLAVAQGRLGVERSRAAFEGVPLTGGGGGGAPAPAVPQPAAPAVPAAAPRPAAAVPGAAPRAAPPAAVPTPGISPRDQQALNLKIAERKAGLGEGQQAVDREYAKDFVTFQMGGGADQAKQLSQLNDVIEALKTENVTGRFKGLMDKLGISSFTTPRSAAVRERVEEVVQRSLRQVLGAQFTENEGQRLIARAFNPALSEQENMIRVERLFRQLNSAFQQKLSAASYFQQNGTLSGWTGKMPSMMDFQDTPDTQRVRSGNIRSSGTGGIRVLSIE